MFPLEVEDGTCNGRYNYIQMKPDENAAQLFRRMNPFPPFQLRMGAIHTEVIHASDLVEVIATSAEVSEVPYFF
jgi:hypothetical protein